MYPAHTQTKLEYAIQTQEPLVEPTYQEKDTTQLSNYQKYVLQAQSSKHWKNAEFENFILPAQGQSKPYCKKWISYGCDNTKQHPHNKHYAEHKIKTCKVAFCPLCFESWINRQANRTTRRLTTFLEKRKFSFRHIILSPPQEQAKSMSYPQLKTWLNQVLKVANIQTACVIFHPFRFQDKKKSMPYVSPHFHLMVYGKVTNTPEFYNKTQWLIKNKGDLKNEIDIFNCARYLLSHCGIKKKTHTVRYLGDISYRKLKVEKEPQIQGCPYCNLPLRIFSINFCGNHRPPPIDYVGLWDSSCFVPIVDIHNDTQIPFYEMSDDPKSDIDYSEELIFSFEELLSIRTNSSVIANYKYDMSLLKFKTAISCKTITSFC